MKSTARIVACVMLLTFGFAQLGKCSEREQLVRSLLEHSVPLNLTEARLTFEQIKAERELFVEALSELGALQEDFGDVADYRSGGAWISPLAIRPAHAEIVKDGAAEYVLVVLVYPGQTIPGGSAVKLILLGMNGSFLDILSCNINSRYGELKPEVKQKPDGDGAQIVVSFASHNLGGWHNWHNIEHNGVRSHFTEPEKEQPTDWDRKGLCRAKVEKGALVVIFPRIDFEARTFGYVDKSGAIIIRPQFLSATGFYEGLAAVKMNGTWGWIDKTGKIVLHPEVSVDEVGPFREDITWIRVGKHYGFVDRTGKVVIQPVYDQAGYFWAGLAPASTEGKFGYLRRNGTWAIERQFDWAYPFYDGMAAVKIGGKYGFIDTNGRMVIEPRFDGAASFSEGLAAVWQNGKCGFVDKTGKMVIEPQWDSAGPFYRGLAPVRVLTETPADVKDGRGGTVGPSHRCGYIDQSGKEIIPLVWDDGSPFNDGLAAVRKDGKCGYVDTTGKLVVSLDAKFGSAFEFAEGLSPVWMKEGSR